VGEEIRAVIDSAGANPEPGALFGRIGPRLNAGRQNVQAALAEVQRVLTPEQWRRVPAALRNPFGAFGGPGGFGPGGGGGRRQGGERPAGERQRPNRDQPAPTQPAPSPAPQPTQPPAPQPTPAPTPQPAPPTPER